MKPSLKHQTLAALALATNSKEMAHEVLGDLRLRQECELIKAKKSNLSRAQRAAVVRIVEKGGII